MNFRRLIIAAAVSLSTQYLAHAAIADVLVCPLEEAMKRLEEYNVTRKAQSAQLQLPILTEIQEINGKAKNPSLPVGPQLDARDQARFQQLREQLLTLQAREIVNSGYLRDSRVIARATKIAHDVSLGRTIGENDPDAFYHGIVAFLSIQHPRDHLEITTPKDQECSVEAGLHFYEQLMMRQINELPFTEATNRLKAIAQQYNLDTKQEGWVEGIPSLQEKQSARIDMGTVNKGQLMLDYMNNMENLKALARVSLMGFESDMEGINHAHTEQELSNFGTVWAERAKNLDERTQILAGFLNMIAQKVPSDSFIESQGRVKTLQQQGIIK